MLPLGDVIPTTVAVVLQGDDGQEVSVLQLGIEGFDFFVEIHHAALAKDA